MDVKFTAMPTKIAQALQNGGLDAYGLMPERQVSDGSGTPCRHCLRNMAKGADYLVLAYCPFPALQPYAETGPIFLCATACKRGDGSAMSPEILESPTYITRGYNRDDRIIYGTGDVTQSAKIQKVAATLFEREDVAYVHVRSSQNNCYQVRIDRAS